MNTQYPTPNTQLAELDRQSAEHMIPTWPWDGPAPYYLNCPLDAIEDVARSLAEGTILFLWRDHVIRVGEREWSLDGDLPLWRKAKAYAAQLAQQGLLAATPMPGGRTYSKLPSPL